MREDRAKAITQQIRAILLADWDPIGVAHAPEAQDEYDGYVGPVYRLLASNASAEEIAARLQHIERDSMGLSGGRLSALLAVASKLKALEVKQWKR